jgi:RHS repeat-associated protein
MPTVLGDLTYEYEKGERRTRMGGSFARTVSPQSLTSTTYNSANQQTAFGNQTLTYDLNGNLTSDGANTYTWNARNQLASISGATTASFQYDASGRRVSKTINGTTTSYLYDDTNTVQEQSGGAAIANMLTGGVDQVFTRSDSSGELNVLRDGLGSTLGLADSNGIVQSEYSYDAFGGTASTGQTSSNASQYTGRENDGTGLYYNRARYYSPQLQRFISEDPIGMAGGINFYAYVENDPVNYLDPSGLDKDGSWYKTWEQWADIRSAQQFWRDTAAGAIQHGNWLGATGADMMGGLITLSEFPEVQRDGETLGGDASIGRKILAGGDLVRIGAGWFFLMTGSEIVPSDPKECRIAPMGNRAWRKGWEPVGRNQLPHYHRRIVDAAGDTVPGGSIKWHRPWEKGF